MDAARLRPDLACQEWNRCRYRPAAASGHYESYFLRANHPTRPLAFWIRYTLFSPRHAPAGAVGELWAIFFDGEQGQVVSVKEVRPFQDCTFSAQGLEVRVGAAALADGHLTGEAASGGHRLAWELAYTCAQLPLRLLPESYYAGGFPKAKAVVPAPLAEFHGRLEVDGQAVQVSGWTGSQNHNWGSQHTDQYAWGQVMGFDQQPQAALEILTARLRLGPFWSPWLTLLTLRLEGQDYELNTMAQALRARARLYADQWDFASHNAEVSLVGRISAPPQAFVRLVYANPPGGEKICLNTKLARCELSVRRAGQPELELASTHRAAFEILGDEAELRRLAV